MKWIMDLTHIKILIDNNNIEENKHIKNKKKLIFFIKIKC